MDSSGQSSEAIDQYPIKGDEDPESFNADYADDVLEVATTDVNGSSEVTPERENRRKKRNKF